MDLKTYLQSTSQVDLARSLGVTPGAVNQWVHGYTAVAADRCAAFERLSGGAVTVEELNPSITWSRVADASWPHPAGRPVVEVAKAV